MCSARLFWCVLLIGTGMFLVCADDVEEDQKTVESNPILRLLNPKSPKTRPKEEPLGSPIRIGEPDSSRFRSVDSSFFSIFHDRGLKTRSKDEPLGFPIRLDTMQLLISEQFTSLAQAVSVAGLIPMLKSAGPITLFAPTNEAFRNLPVGGHEKLLANPQRLRRILLGHILSGLVTSADLANGPIRFASGDMGEVNRSFNDELMVSNAHVTKADVTTSNGVVHVVDKIIIAEPPENLYRTLSGDPRFTVLTKAIKEAGLMSLLESPGSKTLFAPINEAFDSMQPRDLDKLMSNKRKLKKILLSHIVSGKVHSSTIQRGNTRIVSGPYTKMMVSRSGVRKAHARVVQADIPASNGVIHVINAVLGMNEMFDV